MLVFPLRQNLSKCLRLVQEGERLVVTERNRPVAELGPPPTTGEALDRLIAEGRVSRPARRRLPQPIDLGGDPHALSRALDAIRGDRQVPLFVRQSAAARLAGLRTVAPGAR